MFFLGTAWFFRSESNIKASYNAITLVRYCLCVYTPDAIKQLNRDNIHTTSIEWNCVKQIFVWWNFIDFDKLFICLIFVTYTEIEGHIYGNRFRNMWVVQRDLGQILFDNEFLLNSVFLFLWFNDNFPFIINQYFLSKAQISKSTLLLLFFVLNK